MRLNEIQRVMAVWGRRQPWPKSVVLQGLAVSEEAGEISRAILKAEQGIRGTREEWMAKLRDEIGDVVTSLAMMCELAEFDFEQVVTDRLKVILARDWGADPIGHGMPDE